MPQKRHAVGVLKSVTVDAGGVLLLPDPVAVRSILGDFGAYPENATCWRAHFEMLRHLDDGPVPDWHELGRLLASALGVLPQFQDEAGKAVVAEVYEGTAWVAAPGAAEALGRLAASGYRLAVVSNTTQGGLEELLLKTGLCSVSGDFTPVAAVIDSHVVGVAKPDPRIFARPARSQDEPRRVCALGRFRPLRRDRRPGGRDDRSPHRSPRALQSGRPHALALAPELRRRSPGRCAELTSRRRWSGSAETQVSFDRFEAQAQLLDLGLEGPGVFELAANA